MDDSCVSTTRTAMRDMTVTISPKSWKPSMLRPTLSFPPPPDGVDTPMKLENTLVNHKGELDKTRKKKEEEGDKTKRTKKKEQQTEEENDINDEEHEQEHEEEDDCSSTATADSSTSSVTPPPKAQEAAPLSPRAKKAKESVLSTPRVARDVIVVHNDEPSPLPSPPPANQSKEQAEETEGEDDDDDDDEEEDEDDFSDDDTIHLPELLPSPNRPGRHKKGKSIFLPSSPSRRIMKTQEEDESESEDESCDDDGDEEAPPSPCGEARRTTPWTKYVERRAKATNARVAAIEAQRAASRMQRRSSVFDSTREDALPRFGRHELVLGRRLGRGGFSHVHELLQLKLQGVEEDAKPWELSLAERGRIFLATLCDSPGGENRYAVKFLRRDVLADAKQYKMGAFDLTMETKILSALEHPNIVTVRGLSRGGVTGFVSGKEGGYFMIMDRLSANLEDKMAEWKEKQVQYYQQLDVKAQRKAKKKKKKLMRKMKRKKEASKEDMQELKKAEKSCCSRRRNELFSGTLVERLRILKGVANALRYLHEQNVIFRDLKPSNVGLDERGEAQLFDFGLARELDSSARRPDGTFHLRGKAGSARYIAPEVGLGRPYNLSADVYSFGLLVWEVLNLKTPHVGTNSDGERDESLISRRDYPRIPASWPSVLQSLVGRCLEVQPLHRPCMEVVYQTLRQALTLLETPAAPKKNRWAPRLLRVRSEGKSEEEDEEEAQTEVSREGAVRRFSF